MDETPTATQPPPSPSSSPQHSSRRDRRRARRAELDHPRRGTFVALLVVFLVLVSAVVWGAGKWAACGEGGGRGARVRFTVADGATGGEIVDALERKGVIPCGGFLGRLRLRQSGRSDQVLAGEYTLATGMGLEAALDVLTAPPKPVATVDLTIPEGYRLTQIADRVEDAMKIPRGAFVREASEGGYSLPPYLPDGRPLEGFLFPSTYEMRTHGESAKSVIERLLGQFETEAKTLPWKHATKLGLTPYEAVIVASMIEEEARVPGDRPLISAVIHNRLERGMQLGIDATLQYVDPDPSDGLTSDDFQIDSPYNTRTHVGLPPTPIASPGRASLQAALEPADAPYLYYVLCGNDGSHRFSVSYRTFLRDTEECLG